MRGICCFIVIIDHCINFYKPDIRFTGMSGVGGEFRRLIAWTPLNIIYSGIAPVCIFFILSGFVLSLKFNQSHDNKIIFSGVVKRYPRLILPILASMIIMYCVYFLLYHYTGYNMNLTFWEAITQALYFAPFEHTALTNYALWTISYEMYGSFLVFALLSFFGSHKYRILFYSIVFLFLYINNSFYSLFVFGMILSDMFVHGKCSFTAYARIIFLVLGIIFVTTPYQRDGVELYRGMYSYISYFDGVEYKTLYQLFMLTGSMLLFCSLCGSNIAELILNKKPFQYLGKISFPLYVMHATILTVVTWVLKNTVSEVSLTNFLVTFFGTVVLCFMISSLFEKYIDVPAIKISSKLSKKLSEKYF
ncbi:conserved hypothetical membrane protein [Shimwellia blattae DSM 4481 = NBRC 105725]|uniref:Conserved hypothetical membrane protein n=1 Tax=Shimwellia blattae (strain ATCC 29907 / DSM 4481 / JCM 1650 / NBRC 105725 / CDC 9005-74) TaxID=630626 RepID=I2B7Q2_SHIBC|nr:conserved hypothetical membrane protein [Shimwellia blattae DSM 4481 = NBRC 105725]